MVLKNFLRVYRVLYCGSALHMVGVGNQASSPSSKNMLRTICTSTKARPKKIRDSRATIVGNWCGRANFFFFFFENLMLDCMHKFRARSHKISTPCKISTPSSRYGFSHENTGMTLAFRLAWSVLCCGHENRVQTRVTRVRVDQVNQKKSRGGIFGAHGPGNLEFFWSRLRSKFFYWFPGIREPPLATHLLNVFWQ